MSLFPGIYKNNNRTNIISPNSAHFYLNEIFNGRYAVIGSLCSSIRRLNKLRDNQQQIIKFSKYDVKCELFTSTMPQVSLAGGD